MTALYRVLEPLRHDGVDYAPEGVVTLDTPTAAPLVLAGVVAVLPAVERPTRGQGAAGRRAAPAPG
ncbi:MAG: hypothetical protein IPN92_06990 [Chromatiaceae bacterium]|nr:hypothetical protein [Chromatiaceae bacterium]